MDLRSSEEPWGFLRILFKVHKVPLKTRPVVSYCWNLLHPLGQLITECLQPLAIMQKSYLQDSFTLKKELDQQKVPSNARLFIFDATTMYTNIKIGPALYRIGQFSLNNKEHLTVPPAVFMDALCLLMTNKVFQFGDTYWLQKVGMQWDRHQRPLGPQSSSASTRRQCSYSLETDSNYIVTSSTKS